MTIKELQHQIKKKQSFLCIGLDSDLEKIPKHLLREKDPIFTFNKRIIDATHDLCVAYKPNLAFYEKEGSKGWESLKKTVEYIPEEIFTIGDAKRGDIGNTANMYATALFDHMGFDAATVAPYMGHDSVKPFLLHKKKWTILLGLTSNKGSEDFQLNVDKDGQYLFEKVMRKATEWGQPENMMFVVGATNGELIKRARKAAPKYFFLVPGIGAQGGSLKEVVEYAFTENCGLLVNSSRGIIYAGEGEDFADHARKAAKGLQLEMAQAVSTAKGLSL